jgi:hypothetical protein
VLLGERLAWPREARQGDGHFFTNVERHLTFDSSTDIMIHQTRWTPISDGRRKASPTPTRVSAARKTRRETACQELCVTQ